jgi:hypothetical protein
MHINHSGLTFNILPLVVAMDEYLNNSRAEVEDGGHLFLSRSKSDIGSHFHFLGVFSWNFLLFII